ncbi:ribonuclease H2, subunit C [Gautieria morchelliformis]|nr:ribonuclease H2, subunit C [Gautieria morchelliformis]
MSPRTTRLVPSKSALPTITPHLMPFHVEHTGSAPLSTYFIVRPGLQPDSTSADSTDGDTTPGPSLAQRCKARFSSAFRGRTMQGLGVDLPDGYSGIVLKNEKMANGQDTIPPKRPASTKAKRQKGRRATRSLARANADDAEEDGDVVMEGERTDDHNDVVHTLHPTAKFSSFTLWNADVDVDAGRDEYLRALSEYQQLSAEIHRVDQ